MCWPIIVDWNSKIIWDIDSVLKSRYDQKWFSTLVDAGYNPPISHKVIFPHGWWWYWGN